MDKAKFKGASIDVRKGGMQQINRIIFADSTVGSGIQVATSVVDTDQFVRLFTEGGGTMYVRKSDIDNLTKALQKAKEMWKR